MKRSAHSIIPIIIVVLVVAAATAVVLENKLKRQEVHRGEPGNVQTVLPEELLIKGCLFDLGISREDAHITEKIITVYVKEELPPEKIRSAFASLKGYALIEVRDSVHTRVIFKDSSWDILFKKARKKPARIAIIVDDLGLSMEPVRQIEEIDADLTFSVLPMRPHSVEVAEYLHERGREVMLHLPMEGNGKDPGPGAVYAHMSRSQVIKTMRKDIKSVPFISGVNNHMGSVVTSNAGIMKYVMSEVKKSGLFFIDSLTINTSVCRKTARDMGVDFDARDVFLDNERTYEYIRGQVDKLIKISMRHSEAIAICHPHPETIDALRKEIPRIKELGIEIVPVSTLVKKGR